jgi:hypothetical protein
MRVFTPRHLCWRPDIPDFRDLGPSCSAVRNVLPECKVPFASVPDAVDLGDFLLSYPDPSREAICPSSIVCTKLVEYFNYRCSGKIEPLSARFVMQGVKLLSRGDCSGIRTNLKAIRRFGIPPLSCAEDLIDSKMGCFETGNLEGGYSEQSRLVNTDEHRSMLYLRLGETNAAASILPVLKAWLTSGFPIAFGFSVPSSLDYEGFIEFRPTYDSIQGGHAALLVGFDDKQVAASRGAFRIYCPWGSEWGDQGFGWLPYTFAERGIALDFWTIIKPEWVSMGGLFQPA